MNEIEVKVLDINTDEIKNLLISLGGKLVKREEQENYMYNLPPCTINNNGFIRIRRVYNLLNGDVKTYLCSKKIISQGKARLNEEHEMEVLDFKECKSFLDSLNLEFFGLHKKHRESYSFKGALIEFDCWDKNIYPDPYIEIEASNEDAIYEIAMDLNIPKEKITSKSLKEIIKDLK